MHALAGKRRWAQLLSFLPFVMRCGFESTIAHSHTHTAHTTTQSINCPLIHPVCLGRLTVPDSARAVMTIVMAAHTQSATNKYTKPNTIIVAALRQQFMRRAASAMQIVPLVYHTHTHTLTTSTTTTARRSSGCERNTVTVVTSELTI